MLGFKNIKPYDPNEYKGGKFQFNEGTEKNASDVPQVKGRMIIFPSFI